MARESHYMWKWYHRVPMSNRCNKKKKKHISPFWYTVVCQVLLSITSAPLPNIQGQLVFCTEPRILLGVNCPPSRAGLSSLSKRELLFGGRQPFKRTFTTLCATGLSLDTSSSYRRKRSHFYCDSHTRPNVMSRKDFTFLPSLSCFPVLWFLSSLSSITLFAPFSSIHPLNQEHMFSFPVSMSLHGSIREGHNCQYSQGICTHEYTTGLSERLVHSPPHACALNVDSLLLITQTWSILWIFRFCTNF